MENREAVVQLVCNLCGCHEFVDMGARKAVRCAECGSLERTRVMKLMLDEYGLIQPGHRVMHIAPEKGLYEYIRSIPGVQYEVYDLDPRGYSFAEVQQMDLVTDSEKLPSGAYDLIIHSHVMEHVPCDSSAVFYHLHRALKETGYQVFCVPILSGHWDCCLGGIGDSERVQRFGQKDHVRRFGGADLHRTLGMLFPLPEVYDLTETFSGEDLDRFNIPAAAREGYSSSSVLAMGKWQFKLQGV